MLQQPPIRNFRSEMIRAMDQVLLIAFQTPDGIVPPGHLMAENHIEDIADVLFTYRTPNGAPLSERRQEALLDHFDYCLSLINHSKQGETALKRFRAQGRYWVSRILLFR